MRRPIAGDRRGAARGGLSRSVRSSSWTSPASTSTSPPRPPSGRASAGRTGCGRRRSRRAWSRPVSSGARPDCGFYRYEDGRRGEVARGAPDRCRRRVPAGAIHREPDHRRRDRPRRERAVADGVASGGRDRPRPAARARTIRWGRSSAANADATSRLPCRCDGREPDGQCARGRCDAGDVAARPASPDARTFTHPVPTRRFPSHGSEMRFSRPPSSCALVGRRLRHVDRLRRRDVERSVERHRPPRPAASAAGIRRGIGRGLGRGLGGPIGRGRRRRPGLQDPDDGR